MLLTIRHATGYQYSAPLAYTIRQLRLSPRADAHQHTLEWNIHTPGNRHAFSDAFGNLCHILTIAAPHDEVDIIAGGRVEVAPLDRGRLAATGSLSPLVFTVATHLTAPTEVVEAFAAQHLHGADSRHLLKLAAAIRGAVTYQSGATEVTSTATDALLLGQGVCQDHAHLFLACCYSRGIPARYVSGYIDSGGTGHAESHAWVDVWTEQADFTGWTSIDVTNARFASDTHCRLAVGRDYDSAGPVRGIRRGGGDESMRVSVEVSATANAQR